MVDGTRVLHRHKACKCKAVNPRELMTNQKNKKPQTNTQRQKHNRMRDSATDVVSWKQRLIEGLSLMQAILGDRAILSLQTESTQLCHIKLFFQWKDWK